MNLYYLDRTEKYASKGMGNAGGLPKAAAFSLLAPGDPALRDESEGIVANDDGRHVVYHFPNGEPSQSRTTAAVIIASKAAPCRG